MSFPDPADSPSFPDLDTAEAAFAVFDKDMNGDATRDEIESAVLSLHRDRLSLEASMRDLDGAVRRLDDIFMVIVLAIVILILAAMVVCLSLRVLEKETRQLECRLTRIDQQAHHARYFRWDLHPRPVLADRLYDAGNPASVYLLIREASVRRRRPCRHRRELLHCSENATPLDELQEGGREIRLDWTQCLGHQGH